MQALNWMITSLTLFCSSALVEGIVVDVGAVIKLAFEVISNEPVEKSLIDITFSVNYAKKKN